MQIQQDSIKLPYHINGYDDHGIIVNDSHYAYSLILHSHNPILAWPPTSIKEITGENLQQLFAQPAEIYLLGTSEQHCFLAPTLREYCARAQVSLEVMNLSAACRTYALLTQDGRQVAAALIPNKQGKNS